MFFHLGNIALHDIEHEMNFKSPTLSLFSILLTNSFISYFCIREQKEIRLKIEPYFYLIVTFENVTNLCEIISTLERR
jgi:hypothetical protein